MWGIARPGDPHSCGASCVSRRAWLAVWETRGGTDFEAIVRSANFNAVLGETESEVADRLQQVRARLVSRVGEDAADGMVDSIKAPSSATGTPDQVIERLQRMRDLGCEYAIMYFPEAAYDRSGIEMFEQKVIPALS